MASVWLGWPPVPRAAPRRTMQALERLLAPLPRPAESHGPSLLHLPTDGRGTIKMTDEREQCVTPFHPAQTS